MARLQEIVFTYENEDGEEVEGRLPARYEVCPRCDGEGSHTNPNIDGNGITASEWAEWDEEDRDNYMSGVYDVSCEKCGGLRVVPVVDDGRADKALLAAYEESENARAASERDDNYERAYFSRLEA